MKYLSTSILSLFFLLTFLISAGFVLQKKDKPTLYIVGDSTVKNGQGDGSNGKWGWGDPIKFHFDTTQINIENHALGGTSSRSFQTHGLWKPVLDKVKKGDFVLIQFGHNDGGPYETGRARASIKGIGTETIEVTLEATGEKETIYTYGWYIRKYINDVKAKGATPIVVAPIPRNDWDNGKVIQATESYPQWAIQVAKLEKVPYIDLHGKLIEAMEPCGQDVCTGKYFFKWDHTHTTAQGAVLNAHIVANSIADMKKLPLAKYIIRDPEYQFPGKPKMLLIGDSTLKNGNKALQGWADEIWAYFDTSQIEIINKARGGRSSRTFQYEGLWQEVLDMGTYGDFVIMQFGHNDGGNINKAKYRGSIKGIGNDSVLVQRTVNTIEIVRSYGWYMRKYITDARAKGMIPIICSHIPRREWDSNGKIIRADKDYGLWARQIAEEQGAYFIDLNELVAVQYDTLSRDFIFEHYFGEDHTHTTAEGAQLNAQTVTKAIKQLTCCDLKNYIKK